MTDIEIAEKYVMNHAKEAIQEQIPYFKFAEQMFLAGLTASGLLWHKVADDDLPDNGRYVWTNVGAGYHDDDGWWDDFGRLRDVIAWCEPKFNEI